MANLQRLKQNAQYAIDILTNNGYVENVGPLHLKENHTVTCTCDIRVPKQTGGYYTVQTALVYYTDSMYWHVADRYPRITVADWIRSIQK